MASVPSGKIDSWLFVDDDGGGVVRIELTGQQLRIGRDHSNDIWLDHPGCASHALVLYRRDNVDHLKVYEGAKVFLNGVSVAGMHRLYGGDSIRVTDRKFLYGHADAPPEHCLGLTLFDGEEATRAYVMRQTRVTFGRDDGDILLDDPSVADDHASLEFYADDAVFLVPGAAARPVTLDGAPVTGRVRVKDGAVLRLGRLQLRVAMLPMHASGLMRPLASARAAAATSHQRLDAGLHRAPPADRVSWTPPPQDAVPATVIGALPGAGSPDGLPQWLDDLKEDRPAQPPRPLAPRRAPRLAPDHPAIRPASGAHRDASVPRPAPRSASPGPSVRVAPEVFQGERVHHDSQALRTDEVRARVRAQPPSHGGVRPEAQTIAAPLPAGPPRGASRLPIAAGLHEQLTDVLHIDDVRQAVADHYRGRGGAAEPPARHLTAHDLEVPKHPVGAASRPPQAPSRPPQAPSRPPPPPSRPHHASSPYTEAQRRSTPARSRPADLPPSPYSAAPPEGGLYRPSRDAGSATWAAPVAASPQLTGVLDVIPDRPALDRNAHQPDPEAMAQQRRVEDARSRRRGQPPAPVSDAGQGYSHHDPNRSTSPEKPRARGPVDNSPRQHRGREVDNSPRFYDDKE